MINIFTIKYDKDLNCYHLLDEDGHRIQSFIHKSDAQAFARSVTLMARASDCHPEETVKQLVEGKKFINYMNEEVFKDR